MKKIDRKNLPLTFNIWMPFVIYTVVDYWKLPVWVFAIYMTLYVICVLSILVISFTSKSVDIFKEGIK